MSGFPQMFTFWAMCVTFNVTTIENSFGKRSQFASSCEDGKLREEWGLEKCTPLTPPACFMCTPGTSLEGSLSRTKDRRSKGSMSENNGGNKEVSRVGLPPFLPQLRCKTVIPNLRVKTSWRVWNIRSEVFVTQSLFLSLFIKSN